MRRLLGFAVLVAACATGERKAGGTASAPPLAGTWEGRSYRDASDTGIPSRVIVSAGEDGVLRGTLYYTGVRAAPVPIRVREHTDTRFVEEIGPYHSPTVNQDVVTRATGTVKGDSAGGTFETRPAAGGDVIMSGTFRARKVS